jgi:hypothetical protein
MVNFEQYVIKLAVEEFLSTPLGSEYLGKIKHIMKLIHEISSEKVDDHEFEVRHHELERLDREEISLRSRIPIWLDVQEYLAA